MARAIEYRMPSPEPKNWDRLRWRIEVGFKHLKSGSGLTAPPGSDLRSAKAHILSRLLASLLTEPHLRGHLGNSPRRAAA